MSAAEVYEAGKYYSGVNIKIQDFKKRIKNGALRTRMKILMPGAEKGSAMCGNCWS